MEVKYISAWHYRKLSIDIKTLSLHLMSLLDVWIELVCGVLWDWTIAIPFSAAMQDISLTSYGAQVNTFVCVHIPCGLVSKILLHHLYLFLTYCYCTPWEMFCCCKSLSSECYPDLICSFFFFAADIK